MTSHGPGTAIISLIDPVTSEKLAPPILLRLDAPNCTPRGLIRFLTIGCYYSLLGHFGFSSKILMCYPKGAHRLGHLWLQFPTLGCKVSFAHFPGQRRRNKSIICGAINEKIELTVCLEHHELLHICKFDHFPLLPGQRPRTNHLRSKWHIQWEDWDRLLRKNTH